MFVSSFGAKKFVYSFGIVIVCMLKNPIPQLGGRPVHYIFLGEKLADNLKIPIVQQNQSSPDLIFQLPQKFVKP